ncbi:MAG: galactosyldiacylglycerol synthase, partial [Oscillospiraceae bacterium]|nr:galactosyldiacylglycerol synthase [Oscillospiraceae bacterium]
MRVLILSVTTGGGHNAAADSIEAEFIRRRELGEDIDVFKEDFFQYINKFFYDVMDKGYLFVTRYFPALFGKSYDTLESAENLRKAALALSGSEFLVDRFSHYFRGDMPDVILTTHVFCTLTLNDLKARGLIRCPVIGVMTDYCIHPYWEDCDFMDYLVIADELFSGAAVARGIPERKLLPLGIPVRPKFLHREDKRGARLALGLDPDQTTVLVMGGSMGYGNIPETCESILNLDRDYQVAAICGKNEKTVKELQKISNTNLFPIGYANNVELYMDAADCIVTKPGGLTCTELLVKNLPAILVNPIPGPESRNIR